MARVAPILWIVLGTALIVYVANSTDHDTHAKSTTKAIPEDDMDSSSSQFHGFDCKADCSGHQAGYDWAEEHDIADEDDCGGNSESFVEGCKAYVREQQGANMDDDRDPDHPNPDDN
jgi:hypothetical protein